VTQGEGKGLAQEEKPAHGEQKPFEGTTSPDPLDERKGGHKKVLEDRGFGEGEASIGEGGAK